MFEEIVSFRGGHLKQAVHIRKKFIENVLCDDGFSNLAFVSLATSANHTLRLLCGKAATSGDNHSLLAYTNVIELLKSARAGAAESLVKDREAAAFEQKNKGKKLLNLDDAPIIEQKTRHKKIDLSLLPPWVYVKAPGIGPEDTDAGIDMKVLAAHDFNKPLYVELTVANIAHLHSVASHDAASGELKRLHQRCSHTPIGVTGLSRIYSGKNQGKFLVKGEQGLKRKSSVFAAPSDAGAKRLACSFLSPM